MRLFFVLLAVSCVPGRAGEIDTGAEIDAGAAVEARDSGVTALDAGVPLLAPLAPNTWEKLDATNPDVVWEHGAAFDGVTQTWVQTGGHVLNGYPQSSYTTRFNPWARAFTLSRAPVRPQRMCLVDSVFVDSLGRVLLSQGGIEHGSLSMGALSADATSIEWNYQRPAPAGPWLYDASADAWEDARMVGSSMGSRFHSQLAYDVGSDRVAYLLDTQLTLYSPRLNRAWRKPLPPALAGRRSMGMAFDSDRRVLYVFGGSTQQPLAFWHSGSDLVASYDAQVKNDLWAFELSSETWSEVTSPTPAPKGMPTIDFMRVPLVFHPPSQSLFTLQTPTSTYVAGGFVAWPTAQLWRFDLENRTWAVLPTENNPRFSGLMRVGNEGRLFLFGGGEDGPSSRPSLSREVRWLAPKVEGVSVAPAPLAPTLTQSQDGAVHLAFAAGESMHVFRAAAGDSVGVETKLTASAISSGSFVDPSPTGACAYRLQREGESRFSAPAFNQPQRPSGLVAVVESASRVALSWQEQSDLAGYHVYRARGFAPGQRVTTSPVTTASFIDESPQLADKVIRRYWVTAVSRAGLESGESPQAYSVPDSPRWFEAKQVDAVTVELSWLSPPGAEHVEVYFADTHLNTLSLPNDEINAWVASWQKATTTTVNAQTVRFTIPEGSRTKPHTYFFARGVNVLGQAGFITDITSPLDTRFVPATPSNGEWPHK